MSAVMHRMKMADLAQHMLAMPQVEIEPVIHTAKGLLSRTITIPAGTCIVGRIHGQSQLNVCLRGHIRIACEQGVVDVRAGQVIVSPPGTQRAGYAVEETEWMTVLGTEETDPDVVEQTLTFETQDAYEQFARTAIGGPQ
jgi:quercetin dioxygenase-like cupin family protein